jgi:hypothetical protein
MFDLPDSLLKIKRGILLFWAAWFAMVLLTNFTDVLKAVGYLPEGFSLASGNWLFMKQVTAIHGTPVGITALMLLVIMAWEALLVCLFWQAFQTFRERKGEGGLAAVNRAFAVSLALWGLFILADEFFIQYELENTHKSFAILALVSYLGIYLLPDGGSEIS